MFNTKNLIKYIIMFLVTATATKVIPTIASVILVFELEVKKPTAHVNITRDITLGFIKRYNDLITSFKSSDTVFFLIILDKRLSDMMSLFYIY